MNACMCTSVFFLPALCARAPLPAPLSPRPGELPPLLCVLVFCVLVLPCNTWLLHHHTTHHTRSSALPRVCTSQCSLVYICWFYYAPLRSPPYIHCTLRQLRQPCPSSLPLLGMQGTMDILPKLSRLSVTDLIRATKQESNQSGTLVRECSLEDVSVHLRT